MFALRDLDYSNPEAVYWLAVLPLFFALFALDDYRRRRALAAFAVREVRLSVALTPGRGAYWLRASALMAVWLLAVIALMGPRGNPHYPEGVAAEKQDPEVKKLKRRAQELLFVIDSSASMAAADTVSGSSRLDRAKEIVDEVAGRLHEGESFSLWAFTSEPTVLVPSTMDALFFRMQLRNMGINEGDIDGTNLARTLKEIRNFVEKEKKNKRVAVVLISDGGDNALEDDTSNAAIERLASTVSNLEDQDVRFYVVGAGSEEGADIEDPRQQGRTYRAVLRREALEKIASEAGGEYISANKSGILTIADRIVEGINEGDPFLRDMEVNLYGSGHLIYDSYFQYPLALAVLTLAAVLIFPKGGRKKGAE